MSAIRSSDAQRRAELVYFRRVGLSVAAAALLVVNRCCNERRFGDGPPAPVAPSAKRSTFPNFPAAPTRYYRHAPAHRRQYEWGTYDKRARFAPRQAPVCGPSSGGWEIERAVGLCQVHVDFVGGVSSHQNHVPPTRPAVCKPSFRGRSIRLPTRPTLLAALA
jgi:hypothetical protein